MTIGTLIRFLLGQRAAIEEVAGCRQALWLGLALVLTTGFAREYDGEDLLHEPWHLLIPLGASLVTASLLFGLLWIMIRGWGHLPLAATYRMFLTLYWLTAPLAWLYAIPVERFLSPGDSTRANLWLLAIVATWRVVLMIRIVSVVFPMPIWKAATIVLLFADSVLLVVLRLTPLPIIAIMGGVRLTESQKMLQGITLFTAFMGVCVGLLLVPIGLFLLAWPNQQMNRLYVSSHNRPVTLAVWILVAAAFLIWIPILPYTQAEQQLRYQVEQDLKAERIEAALQTMSAHKRSDFPPHWDPPPRIGYPDPHPHIVNVIEVALRLPASDWVQEVYREKLVNFAGDPFFGFGWLDDEEMELHIQSLETIPKNSKEYEPYQRSVAKLLHHDRLNAEQQTRLLNALPEHLRQEELEYRERWKRPTQEQATPD